MDAYKRWIFATSWRALRGLPEFAIMPVISILALRGVFPESLADAYLAALAPLAPLLDPLDL